MRRGSTNAVAVHCDLLSTLTVKKDKQCFIIIVSEKLEEAVCDSIHAAGDADVLIVQSAVSVANVANVTENRDKPTQTHYCGFVFVLTCYTFA